MKHAIRTATAFAFTSLCLCASADAKIVTFQIPNSKGIWSTGMNDKGEVTGRYLDRKGQYHGFLVARDGAVTTFSVAMPMGDRRYNSTPENTWPIAISSDGTIIGRFSAAIYGGGFVRKPNGLFTTFNVGAETAPLGANKKGWIVGWYEDSDRQVIQPFLRDPSGATLTFSVPGAVDASATVVNRSRAIAGGAIVQGGMEGFFRPAHGTAVLFGNAHNSVTVTGINDAGTITGYTYDQNSIGFVRTSDGTITKFLGPNGATAAQPSSINNSGTIAGTFTDGSNAQHGFLRAADGSFTTFDIDGAFFIEIRALNDKGVIAGDARKDDGAYFGFVGKP
jgi:hypothetical protein